MQIWADESYVYTATTSGSNIIDIESELECAYITSNNFTSVWANDTYVFFGSAQEGIKYLPKSSIQCDIASPVDLTDYVKPFKHYPFITSNHVKHIHGREDKIMCCTTSGVDFFRLEPNGYRSSTTCSGSYKCFVPAGGNIYYLTSSGTSYFINKINTTLMDWSEPDKVFVLPEGLQINDLFVTAKTAEDGINNTLFIATSNGVYIMDESTQDFDIYYTLE